jgi:hypothetical protein
MATALATIILMVLFDIFLAGRRSTTILNQSLEANEAVLKTFRTLTRDLRSARKILIPELAAKDATMPDFSWTSPQEGTHRLDLEVFDLTMRDGKLIPKVRRVIWYLQDPKTTSKGGQAVYTLYRSEQKPQIQSPAGPGGGPLPPSGSPTAVPAGMLKPVKMASRVRELIFFRRESDAVNPSPGSGPRDVQVKMISSRMRKRKDGTRVPGYTAELRTTVHIRGGE